MCIRDRRSAANLDRAHTPALLGVNPPLHDIAAAVVIVGIVVSVGRIVVIIVVGVRSVAQAVSKSTPAEPVMVKAAVEAMAGRDGSATSDSGRTETASDCSTMEAATTESTVE